MPINSPSFLKREDTIPEHFKASFSIQSNTQKDTEEDYNTRSPVLNLL